MYRYPGKKKNFACGGETARLYEQLWEKPLKPSLACGYEEFLDRYLSEAVESKIIALPRSYTSEDFGFKVVIGPGFTSGPLFPGAQNSKVAVVMFFHDPRLFRTYLDNVPCLLRHEKALLTDFPVRCVLNHLIQGAAGLLSEANRRG